MQLIILTYFPVILIESGSSEKLDIPIIIYSDEDNLLGKTKSLKTG